MDEARSHVRKIKSGAGKHADCALEIHWNKKAKKKVALAAPQSVSGVFTQTPQNDDVDETLQWVVVVVNEDPIPGGTQCAECEATHFEDDYLCPDCRAAM